MAFQSNNTAAASTNNDSWKAQGFINLYLPRKDGKESKVGMIPLKDSKFSEKQLREWLEADEKNVSIFLSKLIVKYQSATPADTSAFDLG